MLKLLSCAQGHYWEKPIEDGADGTPEICPRCGQAAETQPSLDWARAEKTPMARAEPPAQPLRDPEGRPLVAGYEILAYLGKGPTGVHVYKARQILVNRLVVLKVVFAKDDPRQFAWGSLRGEASALGVLPHPNIVRIHEAGERDRQLFYNALEYVNGPTLAELLTEKPLPIRPAVMLVETLARAVHQAHQKNILHRNLKPASVLLTNDDASTTLADCLPKITDFGLARRATEGDVSDVELQGDLPCYLAPEQAWGRAKEIGPATDTYALGAILYALLGGRPPFRAATAEETLDAIQNSEPPRLAPLRPRISPDLEAICRKCLAKQPRRRYPSALELAEDLRRWTNGYPVQARVAGNAERLGKWLRRNVRTVALVLLSLWTGLSLLLLLDYYVNTTSPLVPPQDRNNRPGPSLVEDEPAKPSRREAAANYVRYLLLAERAAERQEVERAQEMLARCPSELRHWEWHYWHARLQARDVRVRYVADAPIFCMDLSRDGRYLAAGGGKERTGEPRGMAGEVSVWDLQTQARLHHWTANNPVRGTAFSPDGNRLAILKSSKQSATISALTVRDLKTDALVFARVFPNARLASLVYSEDSRTLLAIADDRKVRLLQADDGVEVHSYEVWFPQLRPRRSFARLLPIPSPDEPNRLALVSPDGGQLVLADSRRINPNIDLSASNTVYFALAYDQNSETLAAAGGDQTIRLWNVRLPQQPKALLRGHKGAVKGVSFSSDGKRLASCGEDGTVRIWDVEQELELLRLTGFNGASSVQFRHTQEAFGDGNWRDRGSPPIDRLAIAHGNTVTVLEPR